MDRDVLKRMLDDVQRGQVSVDAALSRLAGLPFEDLGFAKVDHHRALRAGGPEAVFCPGKTPEQVVAIVGRLAEHHVNVLATRCEAPVAAAVEAAGLPCRYHSIARLLVVRPTPTDGVGLIVVAAAGTSDLPVAEEAALVAEALGNRVERLTDCGVAGLHRLLAHREVLSEANAIVAVAGMEGALPSVIGGLVDRPVIAVPTSVGYGTSLNGLAALLAMLNSCAPGVTVCNIDNGFGAGVFAARVARRAAVRP
jgi:pyridinium-3,5-biscarboxylic acid mononucleotide synthase